MPMNAPGSLVLWPAWSTTVRRENLSSAPEKLIPKTERLRLEEIIFEA